MSVTAPICTYCAKPIVCIHSAHHEECGSCRIGALTRANRQLRDALRVLYNSNTIHQVHNVTRAALDDGLLAGDEPSAPWCTSFWYTHYRMVAGGDES